MKTDLLRQNDKAFALFFAALSGFFLILAFTKIGVKPLPSGMGI